MYVYIHDAILREVRGFEEEAKELNRDSVEDVGAFAERMAWFHEMVKVHEHAEEEVLFPALDARFRFVAESYAFDHDDSDVHVFRDIDRALAALRRDGNGSRKDDARLLWRQAVALHEHMRLHISKENELLLPKVESEFDVSEQARLAGAMAGMFEPELMAEAVAWMYRGQTNQDREGMVRFLMNLLPPEPLSALTGRLEALDPAAWSGIRRRIPELGV